MVVGNSLIKSLNLIKECKERNLQPASYDLTVDKIDGAIDETLKAGESVLISTKEWIELPNNIAAFVKTRSSLARIGLSVDFAGWVDPGFKGNLTLLLKNLGKQDFDLRKLDRFGQIIFLEVKGVTEEYDGSYQNSKGLVKSIYGREEKSNR